MAWSRFRNIFELFQNRFATSSRNNFMVTPSPPILASDRTDHKGMSYAEQKLPDFDFGAKARPRVSCRTPNLPEIWLGAGERVHTRWQR
jgi:hypothetical protein